MKMNHLKKEMRKKGKGLVTPPARLASAVTVLVKMMTDTVHEGMKRNLNRMMYHHPAQLMAAMKQT
jgi:hypothetical protein